jgi:hypothetical protein
MQSKHFQLLVRFEFVFFQSKATSKVFSAVGSAVDATLQTPVIKATGKVILTTAKVVADVSGKVLKR